MTNLPESGSVLMYTTTWCGDCVRLKSQLKSAGIPFAEVDIELPENAGTAEYIASLNDGQRRIPTVIFPDGTAAIEPSLREVQQRLGA